MRLSPSANAPARVVHRQCRLLAILVAGLSGNSARADQAQEVLEIGRNTYGICPRAEVGTTRADLRTTSRAIRDRWSSQRNPSPARVPVGGVISSSAPSLRSTSSLTGTIPISLGFSVWRARRKSGTPFRAWDIPGRFSRDKKVQAFPQRTPATSDQSSDFRFPAGTTPRSRRGGRPGSPASR
jgi:hypothetical protein